MRFAQVGVSAVAIDYYGRTAGLAGDRGEGFDGRSHAKETTEAGIAADVRAAADHLRSERGGAVQTLVTVGFCFGGSHSWAQAALLEGLDGAIGLYGQPARMEHLVPRLHAPLLILVAGRDFTPLEEYQRFSRVLDEAGREHEMHVYPEAPHSFFDRTFAEHEAECRDAWRRMLDFIAARSRA